MSNDEEIKLQVAQRLRMARELAGLSQGQVAKIMGLHRPSISELEAGRRNVSVQELKTFSQLYNVEFDWLAGNNPTNVDENQDQIQLAARELSKLRTDDLDRLLEILKVLRASRENNYP
ncbi:MAG: helix-turn-helix transcriptional regulator [Anaerolineaceae bacterium]|nr:helix-turn-helix transcriptional regulator [Anaerolineaceae bacterium]